MRELWKDVPLIIGGIEASLRRMAHYDYWGNDVRGSILADSRADLLVFGMENFLLRKLHAHSQGGKEVSQIRDVPSTCWKTHDPGNAADAVLLPSFEEVRSDKKVFAQAFKNSTSNRTTPEETGSYRIREPGMSYRTGLQDL